MQNISRKIFLVVTEINFFLSHRYDLVKELAERGWEFSIVTDFKKSEIIVEKNIDYIFINSNRENFGLCNLLKNAKILSKIISVRKPDLIYAISHRSIFLVRLSCLFRNFNAIYAITGMGSIFTFNKKILINLFLKILRKIVIYFYRYIIKQKGSYFILQNQDDLNFLISNKIANKNNAFIVPGNGLPDKYFSSEISNNKNFKFIMVSRILRDKGVIEYLSAAQKITHEFPDCEFELFGAFDENNPQSIKKSEIERYLTPNIRFEGFEKNIKHRILQSNVLVLPSYREGFARVLMEAQACSRPVITSNISGCKDVIVENETGFLINPMDVDDLVTKIKYFIQNSEAYFEMSQNSFHHAKNNFQIKQAADNHEEIFNKILYR